jgi:ribosome-binding protein aMBF1 (putative translation factor)
VLCREYLIASACFCSMCGGDERRMSSMGISLRPAQPPARATTKAESCAEFDIPAIVERIKARRELSETSISTLASQLGIRADRLARFESGRVEDEDLPELLRALVWASEFDASAIDAYRKPVPQGASA